MDYKQIAQKARLEVLDMIHAAQTSHIGSNFSVIDILTVLYEKANINEKDWDNRDRIILSKGWAAASLYYFLYRKGLLHHKDLESYCQPGSKFIGLAEPVAPGIEFAGGSMGHGLPAGVGMALAAKKEGRGHKVYVVMSDGEIACGTTWESILLAMHHQLDNLIILIDQNGWQAMGRTKDVLQSGFPYSGMNYFEIDGHNFQQLEEVIVGGPIAIGQPTVIVANTIKGKGVSFMEDKLEWHYKNVDDETYQKAKDELTQSLH